MIRVAIALGLVGATVSAPTFAQERPPADYMDAIEGVQTSVGDDSLGTKTIEELMEQFGVPGVSIAVIWDFDVHWAKGYGFADVETGAPVDTETVFQAASISKPVTAMAVLEAVQDGLFTLDDDINDILKSWQLEGGEFTRDQTVTPRTLTSHTSGYLRILQLRNDGCRSHRQSHHREESCHWHDRPSLPAGRAAGGDRTGNP